MQPQPQKNRTRRGRGRTARSLSEQRITTLLGPNWSVSRARKYLIVQERTKPHDGAMAFILPFRTSEDVTVERLVRAGIIDWSDDYAL